MAAPAGPGAGGDTDDTDGARRLAAHDASANERLTTSMLQSIAGHTVHEPTGKLAKRALTGAIFCSFYASDVITRNRATAQSCSA